MKAQVALPNVTSPSTVLKTTYALLLVSLSLLTPGSRAAAQNSYDIGTPAASKAGEATASTYSMDKIETVNLANGNMSLHIPLAAIGGRGAAGYSIALSYNSKLWSAEHGQDPGYFDTYPYGFFYGPVDHYRATFDDAVMRQPNAIAFGAGWSILKGPSIKVASVDIDPVNPNGCSAQQISDDSCGYKYILTKLWLTLADGSEVELRDDLTNGAPALTPVDSYNYHLHIDRDRGRVWHSTDGSAITYIKDASNTLAGWVFLADGTRLRMELGPYGMGARGTKIIDSQGNRVSIDYDAPAGTTYTDELGRQVVLQSTANGLNVIIKGYGGVADRVITIDTATIGALDGSGVPTNLRADFRSLQRPFYSGDYFRSSAGDIVHLDANPHTDLFSGSEQVDAIDQHVTVTSLHLLDGRAFRFRYNQYGELAEVIYPGGGVSQVDHAEGSIGPEAGCAGWPVTFPVNRIVGQRRSLTNGVNVDAVWSYSRGNGLVDGIYYPTVTVEARQNSITGPLRLSEKHYFLALDADYRACRQTFFGSRLDDTGYEKWENAKEFRVERQTGSGTQLEQRTWGQRAAVVWAPDVGLSYSAYAVEFGQQQPPNDPRVAVVDTILENGKLKRVTYDYDGFNNVILTKENDFGGTNGSLGALVRQTARTYGANIGSNYGAVINGYCYSNLNPADSTCGNGLASDVTAIIHQRRLLLNETVKDANNNQKAYSELEYDNYTSATNHAALIINSGMIQYDGTQFSAFASSCQPRGNVTKATRWAGGSSYIYSFRQYDNAGNVTWTRDPNGNVTTASYADNFGSGSNPDSGVLGTNGATYALLTLTTNAKNHVTKMQYDYTRGGPTGVKDPNGIIAKTEYDLLGRPTRVTAALGLTEQSIAETTYPTVTAQVATASKQLDATRWLASKTVLDGFERPIISWQAEDGQNANTASFTIRADTVYDALGRAKQVSNPYRPGSGETADYTTTAYDLAGRVVSVTTPDNAVVNTAYSANQVLVTDQAGKQRMSQTNGLGQLTDVWEIVPANQQDPAWTAVTFPSHSEVAAGYLTHYAYDTLDDLITVTQQVGASGTTQTRTFVYNPLKRLTAATNPESGTITYQYDSNGNLTQKTDARGVIASYGYDVLNRNTTVTNANDPAGTPSINRYYDGATKGKGRFWYANSNRVGDNMPVEYKKISAYDALGRPLTLRQLFGNNWVWSGSYYTYRTYNLAGAVTSQTYPSGRTVSYSYDNAGRISSFTGNLGDGVTRIYATGFKYDAASRVQQEQFGTTTPLYHKRHFNSRGQLYDMRLSTRSWTQNEFDGNRGAIVNYYSYQNFTPGYMGTDNNGNLTRSETYIPSSDYFQDRYAYDSLNRLTSLAEFQNGATASFAQCYLYDRFGNRRIDPNPIMTWGSGINNKDFKASTNTNRLGVPAGQTGVMTYDAAGNLTNDTYSGNGGRTYDAENRMRTAIDATGGLSSYGYNMDGERVRRNTGADAVWQVYAMDGELEAEYVAGAAAGSPLKEYGYRNGQLLVTASNATAANLALGKSPTQSSTHASPTTAAVKAVDGNTDGALWNGHASATNYAANSWWQIDLGSSKQISAIQVWGRTNCCPETTTNFHVFVSDSPFTSTNLNMTLNQSGVSNYLVAGYSGSPGTLTINRTGRYVRVQLAASQYLVLAEVQIWGQQSASTDVEWLITDHLGTPRIIADKTGTLAGIKRHDYLPFGEELFAGTGGRTTAQGYVGDNTRQKFTSKERDNETGLDYFGARYYSSVQGRFTGVDIAGPNLSNPQSLNKYQYTLNNPLRYIDRNGLYEEDVHYHLTQALAEAAGFSQSQAAMIATGDQMTDETPGMSPFSSREARRNYHFTTVQQRYDLWNDFANGAMDEVAPNEMTLDRLGVFMHAQQDSYSHEGFGPNLGQGWPPWTGTAPDKTYNDPAKADRMAMDSFNRLTTAATVLYNNQKISFLYKPLDQKVLSPLVRSFNRARTPEEKMKIVNQIKTLARENIQRQAEEAIRKKQEGEKRKRQSS